LPDLHHVRTPENRTVLGRTRPAPGAVGRPPGAQLV